MKAQLLLVHALSPLHAGTGQGVGVIDQPVAREVATGLPYLPGSSLKGVLRDTCEEMYKNNDKDKCKALFGSGPDEDMGQAGAVHFGDQRLLLLPVRSLRGTFAWVTSPYLLRRLLRDSGDMSAPETSLELPPLEDNHCLVPPGSDLIYRGGNNQQVILEDLDLQVQDDETGAAKAWASFLAGMIFPAESAWQTAFTGRFCIVADNVLNFLQQTALEVIARIRLDDETKTVDQGGLWYEEALPVETVLAGLVLAAPVNKTGMSEDVVLAEVKQLTGGMVQLGGNATVGRGLCRLQMV